MNQTEIHEKAIRLLEGGHVEVDGHWVFAQIASDQYYPCECCEMDSICTKDSESMMDVCAECDEIAGKKHILALVCSGRR